MNRGFIILAQNTTKVDYVKCAAALAKSIKRVMPGESISLVTSNNVSKEHIKFFDNIIPLPYGDIDSTSDWKLSNDWQVYEASPYEYTIKLEADMYMPKDIRYWWDVLKDREIVISTTIRNFKQEISDCRVYRAFIDDNNLPDCYNAITYFKKSELSKEFFDLVRHIFENWSEFRKIMKCKIDEPPTTDWVYAIVSHLLGKDKTTLPTFTDMSMVHMKQFINGTYTEDWTDTFVYEFLDDHIRINTVPQMYPFHYHKKVLAKKLLRNIHEKR